jgi:beta-glucanase (GH16 family)
LVRDGNLVIRLYKQGNNWVSSNVQTMNSKGKGFAQKYGYFEMRAKFPPGIAAWCAFWLHASKYRSDNAMHQLEVDVVEAYGGSPRVLHSTLHFWPAPSPKDNDGRAKWGKGYTTRVDGMFEGYHTYGVDVSPDWITFYYDGRQTGRIKAQPEARTPLYMLVSLAMLPRYAKAQPPQPMEMLVDYVKVWQNPAYGQ